jgi:hypothetical protein
VVNRVVLAALTLLVAGCGSSSTSSSSATGPLTPAAWRQKVDAICADAWTETNLLRQPMSGADLQAFLKQGVKIGTAEIARLEAVTPPSPLALQQKRMATDLRLLYGKLRSLVSGAGGLSALGNVASSIAPTARDFQHAASTAGLKQCDHHVGF